MPELPEVESLRRDLSRTLLGRTIRAVTTLVPGLFRTADNTDPSDLCGRQILRIRRRAKLLILELTDGLSLIAHAKLAGQWVHLSPEGAVLAAGGHPVPAFGSPLPHKATRAILSLDDGSKLYFTDIRRFGFLLVLPTAKVEGFLADRKLGPEPLEPAFDFADFRQRLRRRQKSPVKAALLDQSLVAGLGNIYADEALHVAGIQPTTPIGRLSDQAITRLYHAISAVLTQAVEEGVAQIRGDRALPGRDFPRVHGRAGEPCFACGSPIARIRLAGRSTYFCPDCQPSDE